MPSDAAPLVSVVVPTYNSSRYIEITLASILAQTMADLEVVVIDDGSHDDTLDLVTNAAAGDGRVRIISSTHLGIAANRNAGFAATDRRAQFVTFFDHDDVWEPGALKILVDVLRRCAEHPAGHGLARCIDDDGVQFPDDDHAERTRHRRAVRGSEIVPLSQDSPTSFNALLVENFVTTPGTSLIRRDAFESIGGFFPAVVPCDDWDLNVRLARLGPLAFVDEVLLNWRRHAAATSQTMGSAWRHAYLLTRQRSIEDPRNTPEQREAAVTAGRLEMLALRHAARDALRHGAVGTGMKRIARSFAVSRMLRRCDGAS